MVLVMRGHHTCKPVHLGRDPAARDEEIARRENGLTDRRHRVRDRRRENPQPYGDITDAHTRNARLIHESREPFRRRLTRREPALGNARPLRGKRIEDFTAPDRGHGRETSDDESVSTPSDERPLQDEPGETRIPRPYAPHLRHAPEHLCRAEMDANA